jgi:hypothetical protein
MGSPAKTTSGTASLSSSYVTFALVFPTVSNYLGEIWLNTGTIAGGGTGTITWFLSSDAAGKVPVTPTQTDTLVSKGTVAVGAGVARSLQVPWRGTSLYVQAMLDAGTAAGTVTCSYTPL